MQPYQESAELERLMASMKKFYGDASKHHQMSPEDLLKDNFFAALHTDGLWYRVKINSQVDSCTLAVKIVDFGDFSLVPLENLQPLWPQFRNLPMQAINATLAGSYSCHFYLSHSIGEQSLTFQLEPISLTNFTVDFIGFLHCSLN